MRHHVRDAIHLGRPLPDASTQPTRTAGLETGLRRRCSRNRAVPIRSCSRWGLPCRRRCRRRAVGSYSTLSPLPGKIRFRRFAFCGTFPRVGPRRGCYPAPCFHGARTFLSRGLSALAAAAVRPTGASGLSGFRLKVKQEHGLVPVRRNGFGPAFGVRHLADVTETEKMWPIIWAGSSPLRPHKLPLARVPRGAGS